MSLYPMEQVMLLIRDERNRQIEQYGSNEDIELGFGGNVSDYPWLLPFTGTDSSKIEAAFRADYEIYDNLHGKPTWMHLIREEVAELFDTDQLTDALTEAVQVAALCVSLCEQLITKNEGQWQ